MGFFELAYEEGVPPWDIGRAQPEIVRLAESGEIKGVVLDVGCGTGENALYLAGLGHDVWGIDSAPTAIERAQEKAKQRDTRASFLIHDALDLASIGRTFDTVVDCGLFHTFSDEERPRYAKSLADVLRLGGTCFVLCFSDEQSGDWGPRRVTQAEIRATFGADWRINYIRPARFETNMGPECCNAWLASITRLTKRG